MNFIKDLFLFFSSKLRPFIKTKLELQMHFTLFLRCLQNRTFFTRVFIMLTILTILICFFFVIFYAFAEHGGTSIYSLSERVMACKF